MEDELTRARKAQLAAEGRVLELESLVTTLEGQRDYVDRLLLNLTAASQEYLLPRQHPAYRRAARYVTRVATLDKYERRLMEP